MVRYFFGIICAFSAVVAAAQPADTLNLPEFETTEFRFRQLQDFLPAVSADSAAMDFYRQGSVVDLLQNTFPVMVRSNGPSSSVTISNRGLAAAHTAVYWNGINMNAPTTGLADFSLIPAAFIDNLALSLGGSSAVMGSGLIGGGIHLNHHQSKKEEVSVALTQTVSSISIYETALRAAISEGKWQSRTHLLWHRGKNAYRFYNHAKKDSPEEIRSGNDFLQYGFTQSLRRDVGNHKISLDLWALETAREIPPGITAADLEEEQNDRNLKAVLQSHLNFNKIKSRIQLGYLHDELQYQNKHENNSEIESSTLLLNADFSLVFNELLQINFGSSNQVQHAEVAGFYKNEESVISNSIYAGSHFNSANNLLGLHLMLRYDAYSNYTDAFSPSVAASYRALRWLNWKFSASRNYRIPGFNDRFWIPGGDPDLQPEDAWQLSLGPEIGLFERQHAKLGLSISGFYNHINNWIQWIPMGAYWGAVSYKSVRTAGGNVGANFQYQKQKWKISGSGEYSFTYAQNLESEFDEGLSGKILPHVPVHKGAVNTSFGWSRFNLFLNTSYTGARYISTDNNREIEPFLLAHLGLGYSHALGPMGATLQFRVHNLTNKDYQLMPWMPMPLRYYSITLKINFNK